MKQIHDSARCFSVSESSPVSTFNPRLRRLLRGHPGNLQLEIVVMRGDNS